MSLASARAQPSLGSGPGPRCTEPIKSGLAPWPSSACHDMGPKDEDAAMPGESKKTGDIPCQFVGMTVLSIF